MENRKRAGEIALGGVLGAVAVLIMCMGTFVPGATYACPMLCMMLVKLLHQRCGRRIALAWYGAVAILGLLMAPDKEAAAVFLAFGYYPLVKPLLDRLPCKWLWKLVFFNVVILLLYWLLMRIFGLSQIAEEFQEMGRVFTALTLLLGNFVFLLLDRVLERNLRRKR